MLLTEVCHLNTTGTIGFFMLMKYARLRIMKDNLAAHRIHEASSGAQSIYYLANSMCHTKRHVDQALLWKLFTPLMTIMSFKWGETCPPRLPLKLGPWTCDTNVPGKNSQKTALLNIDLSKAYIEPSQNAMARLLYVTDLSCRSGSKAFLWGRCNFELG